MSESAEREPEILITYNNVRIGEAVLNTDGYYVFFPDTSRGGYWDAAVMRHVIGVLDEINREWDEQVNSDETISRRSDEQ